MYTTQVATPVGTVNTYYSFHPMRVLLIIPGGITSATRLIISLGFCSSLSLGNLNIYRRAPRRIHPELLYGTYAYNPLDRLLLALFQTV